MVSILPSDRSGLDVLGRELGAGMTRAMPQMYENQKFQRGMSAIDKLQESLKPQDGKRVDQSEVLANLARVQAQLPGFERSPYMEYVMKQAAAEAMKDAPRAGEEKPIVRDKSDLPQISQRPQPPEFGPQGKGQPNHQAGGMPTGKGNVPQAATTGKKTPIPDPREKVQMIRKLNEEQRAAGRNVSMDDTAKEVDAYIDDLKENNRIVDAELKQRVEGQKEYGARASQALKQVYEKPSPELDAYFQKKGEIASENGESEADINAHLAKEARILGNAMANITNSPTAVRSYNKLGRALNGTYRSFDEAAEDLRRHGQPLLDAGLYDLFRKEVTNLGYYPEEREIVVNPLSMGAQSSFNGLPKIRDINPSAISVNSLLPPPDLSPLKEAIVKAKGADKNFSLVLGRKIAEDKGYDWSNYKNALNELEKEGFELTPDQRDHRGELDRPPTNFLTGFLNDLGFTGR